jgi:hypothetical protein
MMQMNIIATLPQMHIVLMPIQKILIIAAERQEFLVMREIFRTPTADSS